MPCYPKHSLVLTGFVDYEADETTASLHQSVIIVRRKFVNELDDVEDSSIESVAIENVLEYIERQRLIHMPHRGSHWDKVLKWAEFFALQLSRYAAAAEPFASESKAAARLIWTATKSLLNVSLLTLLVIIADNRSSVPIMLWLLK